MNREDFTEDSVEQKIFDYWNGESKTIKQSLSYCTKKELVEFISELQGKGILKGYCHP